MYLQLADVGRQNGRELLNFDVTVEKKTSHDDGWIGYMAPIDRRPSVRLPSVTPPARL